jgi:hypothetical protein|tara:strand:- start:204 stop:410 length:207 start_codon:yes stop_codon:yes gene_type:complete
LDKFSSGSGATLFLLDFGDPFLDDVGDPLLELGDPLLETGGDAIHESLPSDIGDTGVLGRVEDMVCLK